MKSEDCVYMYMGFGRITNLFIIIGRKAESRTK